MNGKEFKKALDNIVKEKNIDPEVVYDAMELALTSAYKKNFNSKTNVKVLFDRATGEIKVYSYLTVVPDDKMTKEEYEDYLNIIQMKMKKRTSKKRIRKTEKKKLKKHLHSLILKQKLNLVMLKS